MSSVQSSGLNLGYVGQLLEQYLDNPEGVDPAWREFFESGDELALEALPGLDRLVESRLREAGNGGATGDGSPAHVVPLGRYTITAERRAAPS